MHDHPSAATTTYHIEVKSTTAGYDEPYHMSALQMEKCQQLSEAAAGGGKDVFVVFRVYDLSRGGRLRVYVDPWKEIVAGKMGGRRMGGWFGIRWVEWFGLGIGEWKANHELEWCALGHDDLMCLGLGIWLGEWKANHEGRAMNAATVAGFQIGTLMLLGTIL